MSSDVTHYVLHYQVLCSCAKDLVAIFAFIVLIKILGELVSIVLQANIFIIRLVFKIFFKHRSTKTVRSLFCNMYYEIPGMTDRLCCLIVGPFLHTGATKGPQD